MLLQRQLVNTGVTLVQQKFPKRKCGKARPFPNSQKQIRSPRRCQGQTRYSPEGRTGRPQQKSNYELFNRNNFNIRYWSWNYRGCWHQTCPPIVYRRGVYIVLIPITRPYKDIVLLFIVTTSKSFHWVICAPAAFRRSGGHFSGPLSSIEP